MSNSRSEELTREAQLSREAAEAELESFLKPAEGSKTESVVSISETPEAETTSEDSKDDLSGYTDLEREQMEHGWDPKKVGGVDAAEFKRVGEIIEAKRKASAEARELTKKLDDQDKKLSKVVKHFEDVEKAAYAKARAELQAEKDQKILEGDLAAVKNVELRQATMDATAPAKQESLTTQEMNDAPDIRAFKEEYKDVLVGTSDRDIAIQGYIQKRAQDFMTNNPNIDPKEAVDSIRAGIKKAFPDTNHNKSKPAVAAASTTTGGVSGNYSLSRLDSTQRMVYEEIRRADKSYSVEDYIKQLQLTGRMPK